MYAFLFAGIGNYVVCACISALTFSIFVILVNIKDIVQELSRLVKRLWRMPFYLLVSANRSCMRVSVHMAKTLTCYMLLYF